MAYIVGIDFGTSTTVVRYKEEGSDVVRNLKDRNHDVIPSVIFESFDPSKEPLFGYEALALGHESKGRFITNFKMGLRSADPAVVAESKRAIELFLTFIHRLFAKETAGLAGADSTVYISYPAKWTPGDVDFMKQAVVKAGFKGTVVGKNEPTAATYNLLHTHLHDFKVSAMLSARKPMHVLMLDMGAGTSDIVIFRLNLDAEGAVEVTNLLSYPHAGCRAMCGGREIDSLLSSHVLKELGRVVGLAQVDENVFNVANAKDWKDNSLSHVLACGETAPWPASAFSWLQLACSFYKKPITDFHFSRADFEHLTRTHWVELYDMIREAVSTYRENYGIGAEDIDLLYLTGAHSQWYTVPRLFNGDGVCEGLVGTELDFRRLREEPWRMFLDSHPHECVATGLCMTDMALSVTNPAANNVWVRFAVAELATDYVQILSAGDALPLSKEIDLPLVVTRNLLLGNHKFDVSIDLMIGATLETAVRESMCFLVDDNSFFGRILAFMFLGPFSLVNLDWNFNLHLCFDALEDGSVDLHGTVTPDEKEPREFTRNDLRRDE